MVALIVHGGGSPAKSIVLENKHRSDYLSQADLEVVKLFRETIITLNNDVVRVFREAGIKCKSFTPHTIMTSRDGLITRGDTVEIERTLADGVVPILYCDVLVDEVRDYFTCSSDQIASYLARRLGPETVVFLTDADGVYEHYPPKDQAKPLAVVGASYFSSLSHNYQVGKGDMHGKLEQAIACAPFTRLCCIINGRVRGNLMAVLRDKIHVGTRVVL